MKLLIRSRGVAIAALVVGVVAAARFVPIRRIVRVTPVDVLRHE